ncbi:acyltransferase family protein [Virgisporangium aurantiacum]|uniref:Acyltransferase n=1 Tax=Virgisporangium aurantiacum TaxID=175570 RepID=A0A8J3Z716_9ACTN|nr:acyltransferase [Virgisporangium aurantiacum]GIJ58606.1 acyltransferase [Virgisporangium aurantiacum]
MRTQLQIDAPPGPAAPPVPEKSRLPSLTGLRWIGAMLVFGFHVGTMGIMADEGPRTLISRVFGMGLSGVQFFYILSGFVLVWSFRPGEKRMTFYRRRIVKILPNHAVLWLAVILLVGVWWGDPVNPVVAVVNLFLVQAWFPANGWFYSINTVSWSLSCELFFYLCLPLVLPLIRRLPAWALYAVAVALPLLMLVAIWPGQLLVPESWRWWFTQVFPVVRSLEFWLGVVAAELSLRSRWRGPGLPVSLGVFAAAWVVCSNEWVPAVMWPTVLAVAYIVVIAAAARADVENLWSPFRNRPLRWLGEVSFAFYMVHVFVVTGVLRAVGQTHGYSGWAGLAASLGLFGLCLGSAALLYRYVEQPMVRLLGPRRPRYLRPSRAS